LFEKKGLKKMATAMLAKGERTTQGPNSFKNVAEYNSTTDKDNL
jgi:hypothetical protein